VKRVNIYIWSRVNRFYSVRKPLDKMATNGLHITERTNQKWR